MKKLSFLSLALVLVLVGAGCSGTGTEGGAEATDSGSGEAVSIFSTGELVNDLLYNTFTDALDGHKLFTFDEQEGTCSDLGFGSLVYEYDEDYYYHTGMAGELEGLVSLGTNSNLMTWYFSGAEGGAVTCDYTIDGETFDMECRQANTVVCSGTMNGLAM